MPRSRTRSLSPCRLQAALLALMVPVVAPGEPATDDDSEPAALGSIVVTGETGTKTEEAAFRTPFTVNSVTREFIDFQQPSLLKDVLRNVSGVVGASDNGGTNDNFTLRGFDLDAFAYRNGVRLDIPQFDPASIERVDVLKGAAANLYGRTEPGGMVNVVTKKPLADRYLALEQRFGEFAQYRTEGDATGPISADGRWLYRLVFSYQNNGSFRDFTSNERLFLFPALTWRPTPATEFNLSLEYKNNDDSIDYGIPALGDGPAPVPHERYFGVVDARSDRSFYLVDANWSHAFTADWQVRHRFLWYFNETDYQDAGPLLFNPFDQRLLDLFVSAPYREEYDEYFTEVQLSGRLYGLGMQHDLFVGLEYNRATHDNDLIGVNSLTDPLTLRPIDIFNPAYQRFRDLPPATVAGNYNLRSFFSLREKEYWYAVTAQDVVRLHPRLTLAMTGRYDVVANVSSGTCLQTTPCNVVMQEVEDDVFSPRLGASFEVLPWLAIYGSYARSFGSPSGASVLADGSPAGFERGEQKEAGLKGQWFDGRLTASLAFYHLTKSNLAVTTILPGKGVVADVVGEARSQGIEIDVRGDVTDRLSLLTTYAFTDARITEDQDVAGTPPVLTDGRKGLRLANAPEQAATIWVNYAISDAFGVGGGVFAMTEREVDADNLVEIPGYVRLDLAARYRHRFGRSWVTAQLNVNNLLDKEYFDPQTSFAQTVNVSPAAPRTVLGSVRVEF